MKTLALILACTAGVLALAVFLALALGEWLCSKFNEERSNFDSEEDPRP